jgi:prophage DNA circulation protein
MAKKKKQEVVEETIQETQEQVKEQKPEIDESKFKSAGDDSIIKVDLNKTPKIEENADQKQETTDVVTDQSTETIQEVVEEVSPEQTPVQDEETPVLEEITDEEVKEEVEEIVETVEEAVSESESTGKPLPENVQKLMEFMDDTGGDLNDYVKLNQDYSEMDNQTLLYEYYKNTKPHLTVDEINFLMEDQFSYDEEADDERDIRRKKLALKEQVADAKDHLDGLKSKYYEDIKAGSKLTQDQQKAIDFFNRYSEESEETQKEADRQKSTFLKKTDQVFSDKFKGFDYKIGEKKFRFNVKNPNEIKETQSNINNFVKKFLNKDNTMKDAAGYHKSLYTAMNADAIANHFYEQGKADALKDSVAKAKNVNMQPRQSHGEIEAGGLKYRVLGNDSSDFKFKIKNNK